VKLEAAQASIARGNSTAAFNQLGAFINEVEALVHSGRLSSDMGQMLIDLASTAQAGLSPTFPRGAKAKMNADISAPETNVESAERQVLNPGVITQEKTATSTGRFTLNLPGASALSSYGLTSPVDGAVVSISGMVVKWNHVTDTPTGAPLTRTGYQIMISKVVDDAQGSSRPTFDVRVRPSVTSLTVPSKSLAPKTQYELKLVALGVSGKQTVSVIHFTTQ